MITISDALRIKDEYYERSTHTEDEDFRFTEALGFLIEETKDPQYMTELAWHYCHNKRFDLEIKYLEMAAELGDISACEELGYMWYYGQHGEQDYEKAYRYFSIGASDEMGEGSLWCKYKLADMYHHGCYVEKDDEKYRKMIEEAYEKVKNPKYTNEPFPEIAYRLAGIRTKEGKKNEAIDLLYNAKMFMTQRLYYAAFWGHIEVMGRIVRSLYELTGFNEEGFDLYDIFYLENRPRKITFRKDDKKYTIKISEEDNAIHFDGKWYRNFLELCEKAVIDGEKITSLYYDLYDFKEEE